MKFLRRLAATVLGMGLALAAFGHAALADYPRPWEIGMQKAASPVEADIQHLHSVIMAVITVITLFVAALLVWIVYRYDHKRNAVASRTSHHTMLEVAWTTLPVVILLVIWIPSIKLVFYQDRAVNADMTVKVTGHQWYWEYTYPDQGGIDFSSYVVPDDQLKPGQMRLLAVDNELVVPAGKTIRVLTNSSDVIHSFFVPSLGMQRYAIPGRTIETWFKADAPGTYYGECNQICGINHSAMPIAIRAVPEAEFDAWVQEAKKKYAATETAPARLDVAEVAH